MERTRLLVLAVIVLTYIEKSTSTITIPLKVENVPTRIRTSSFIDRDNIYLRSIHGLYYTATILVGTGPSQPQTVMFDTGSGWLWVSSAKYCVANKDYCGRHNVYDDSKSRTFRDLERQFFFNFLSYLPRYIKGNIVEDTVFIDDIVLEEQVFVEVFESDKNTQRSRYDGVFGLGLEPEGGMSYVDIEAPFITLSKSDLIPSGVFAFYFSKTGSKIPSQLTVGGIDKTRYRGHFVNVPLISDKGWIVNADRVSVGRQLVSESIPVLVRSATTGISGPNVVINAILKVIGGYKNPNNDLFFVDCNTLGNLPPITFVFNNQPVIMYSLDYVILSIDDDGDVICLAGLTPANINIMVVGVTFMKAHYTVFDLDSRQISFAPAV